MIVLCQWIRVLAQLCRLDSFGFIWGVLKAQTLEGIIRGVYNIARFIFLEDSIQAQPCSSAAKCKFARETSPVSGFSEKQENPSVFPNPLAIGFLSFSLLNWTTSLALFGCCCCGCCCRHDVPTSLTNRRNEPSATTQDLTLGNQTMPNMGDRKLS